MRKLLIIAAAVILIAGIIYWSSHEEPLAVRVHSVDSGRVESTVANTRAGTLSACQRARLSLAVGGQIDRLPIDEGDQVSTGQLLLELWNDDLEAQLQLNQQQHQAALARAEESCSLAAEARRNASRMEKLYQQELVSEGTYSDAQAQQQSRSAACTAAKANVRVSEAQVAVAEAALARTRLVAPFDGIIAEINGELSEFVTPSPVGIATPPAVDLIDNRCVFVEAPIDEVDAPAIHAGQPTRILLDAFSDQVFDGKVRRVAPYVLDLEKQARTVAIEVDFVEPPQGIELKPGFSADVEVLLEARDNVLRIPTEAVLEGPRVWLIGADDTITEQDIATGISNWRWSEVTAGLQAGDRIVLSVDKEGLRTGRRVSVASDE